MTSISSVTRVIDGRTVVIACASGQEPLAEGVLSTIEGIARTSGLRSGLRIRFGWSLLTLREEADGKISVCEPDFEHDPLTDVRPRIDITLEVLANQTRLAHRLRIRPAEVTFDQTLLAEPDALVAKTIHLVRSSPPDGNDSGWIAGSPRDDAASDEPPDVERLPVYMLLRVRRVALTALILPVGFAVTIVDERLETIRNADGQVLLST